MPRATPVPDNEETSTAPKRVRRAPRKKVVVEDTPSVDEVAAAAPAPASAPVRRKAPTRRVAAPAAPAERVPESHVSSVSASPRPRRGGRLQVVVVLGALIIGIGASAAIGLSDSGKIDVAARIQEQSQLVANQSAGSESGSVQTIPVQNTPVNIPNGGLVPAGDYVPPPPPPPPEPASTTASTTEETMSTSTESGEEEAATNTTSEEAAAFASESIAE